MSETVNTVDPRGRQVRSDGCRMVGSDREVRRCTCSIQRGSIIFATRSPLSLTGITRSARGSAAA